MTDPAVYETLAAKEFKSTIPAHLLDKLNESERYMVETLSRLENQYDWMLQAIVHQSKAVSDLNRRQSHSEEWRQNVSPKLEHGEKSAAEIAAMVKTLWDWKNTISGKTGIAFWVATMLIPLLLKVVIDWLFKP